MTFQQKQLKRQHNRIKNRIKNGHGKPGDEQRTYKRIRWRFESVDRSDTM